MNKTHLPLIAIICCSLFAGGLAVTVFSRWTEQVIPITEEKKSDAQPEKATTATEQPKTDTNSPTPTPTSAPAKTAPKPTAKTPTRTTPSYQAVNITANGFSPQIIAIFKGEGVTWINKDTKPHTTKADQALLWDSGNLQPGAKYSRLFPAVGSYAYTDGSYPQFKGTVVVTERPGM